MLVGPKGLEAYVQLFSEALFGCGIPGRPVALALAFALTLALGLGLGLGLVLKWLSEEPQKSLVQYLPYNASLIAIPAVPCVSNCSSCRTMRL